MDTPAKLIPLEYHGINFRELRDNQAVGDCVFCGKQMHLYANIHSGQWDCKVCGRTGNVPSFLKQIVQHWHEDTDAKHFKLLARQRGIPAPTLRRWGIGYDGDAWLMHPGDGACDVRIYRPGETIRSTRNCKTALFGSDQLQTNTRGIIWLCEGEWDTMAMDCMLRKTGRKGMALGVPGANTFKDSWITKFANRDVVIVFDHDPPGYRGADHVAAKIASVAKTLRVVKWPEHRPEGFDVRDLAMESIPSKKCHAAFKLLLAIAKPYAPVAAAVTERPPDQPKPKLSEVIDVYRKWFEVDDDWTICIKVMMAVVMSNYVVGRNPVWMFVVGPSGSGKTSLLRTLDTCTNCIFQSSLTPHTLVSGWQGEDSSLIPRLKDKVFVLKDYTELLSQSGTAQEVIFGQLRGAYDCEVERSYGNNVKRSYKDCRFSMLAAVTSAIHGNTHASLGERFIKLQTVTAAYKPHDAIRAGIRNIGQEIEMDRALTAIMRAYVDRLDLIPPSVDQVITDKFAQRLSGLSQLVGMIRSEVDRNPYRPDEIQRMPEVETGTRLGIQLAKLAIGLCMVEQQLTLTEDIYQIVERVAFNSAIGFNLSIVQSIMEHNNHATRDQIHKDTSIPMSTCARSMENLQLLKIVRRSDTNTKTGRAHAHEYALDGQALQYWNMAEVKGDYQQDEHKYRPVRKRKRQNTEQ